MIHILHFIAASDTVIDTSGLPNQGSADTSYLNRIVTIVFAIAASTALLLVVINAFRYILARGEPQAVASARNGIIYALVGLVVVMAAYGIVTLVVGATT